MPVAFGPEADDQLHDIERYIAGQGAPEAGCRFARAIFDRCMAIGGLPLGGSPRDDLLPGLRTVPFRTTMIAYTVEENTVVIQAIMYGGQDIVRHFTSRSA